MIQFCRLAAVLLGVTAAGVQVRAQMMDEASVAQPGGRAYRDPVSQLDRKLASGEVKLRYEEKWGYLRSLLEQLDIHRDSQILVFSKTSFQQELISPEKPRALYYNDNVIVGAVQNANVFEFVSLDPTEGLLFFSLEQKQSEAPRLKQERGSCTFCHGPINKFAQGVMVATVFPDPTGKPSFERNEGGSIFKLTDHRSPFEDRWGGYYVTGTHGSIKHRGNAVAPDPARPHELDTAKSSNVTSLEGRFDVSKYLEPTSDLIALMTFEHQTMMTNILTSVGAQFRASETFPLPAEQLDAEADRLVKFLLFIDETRLESPIQGKSTFAKTFAERGPRDSQGRSLRDFDLQTRLFKYPLSYMIYSPFFDALPDAGRERIYRRLYDVLTGKVTEGGYSQLSAEGRRDLLEILVATKKGLPAYFQLGSSGLN